LAKCLINYLNTLNDALLSTKASDSARGSLELDVAANQSVGLLRDARESGGKVLLVGNGGSAAVASHMQNDLSKAGGIQALVFTEQPLLTAYSNDDGYESAYESMSKLWARSNDVMIAISSSGRSENILRACNAMEQAGGRIITFSGFNSDNSLRSTGDVNFYVDSGSYGIVETAHAALGHYLTDALAGLLDSESN
jgi:D-sedoheptulose 7-phosphate isomerase